MKRVAEYMKKAVVYFTPEDTIFHVAKILSDNEISGAPVLEDRKLVGMISETDVIRFFSKNIVFSFRVSSNPSFILLELLRKEVSFYRRLKDLLNSNIRSVMNKKVITIRPEDSVIDAAEKLSKYDIRRLPVVNERGELVGIISRTDILRAFCDL